MLSLSDIIVFGTPCNFTISVKYNLAMCLASSTLVQAMKWAILENLSTTTMIESFPRCVLGKAMKKSMVKCSQGLLATGKGMYSPLWKVILALIQASHLRMYLPTVPNILGQ